MFNTEAVNLFFFELAGTLQAALDYLQNDQDISVDEVHEVEIDEVYPGEVPGYWRVLFPEFGYECWVTSYSRDGYYNTRFKTIVGQSLAA